MSRYRRGDVLWLNLTDKMRPWVVVSNDIGNLHSERVTVVSMTTQKRPQQSTHCFVKYGNVKPSTICTEEVRTISPPPDTKIFEHLPRGIMKHVSECLRVALDIENNI